MKHSSQLGKGSFFCTMPGQRMTVTSRSYSKYLRQCCRSMSRCLFHDAMWGRSEPLLSESLDFPKSGQVTSFRYNVFYLLLTCSIRIVPENSMRFRGYWVRDHEARHEDAHTSVARGHGDGGRKRSGCRGEFRLPPHSLFSFRSCLSHNISIRSSISNPPEAANGAITERDTKS